MTRAAADYAPEPERRAGWRWPADEHAWREAGVDPERLGALLRDEVEAGPDHAWGLVVVRRGWLVGEAYSHNVASSTRFDVWSCTKSLTALGWLLLLAEHGGGERLPLGLDAPIYDLLPDAHPLSDPRKEQITIRHVLSMTSGIPGEAAGFGGLPSATDRGVYETAYGHVENRFGRSVARLHADPGARWDYSDPGYAHLGPAFAAAAGIELRDYLSDRLFEPLGLDVAWDLQGGCGFLGPHTNPHTGLHMSARDLSRLGFLLARGGRWGARRILPEAVIEQATTPSQSLNPAYGLGFWTNAQDAWSPGEPAELVGLAGWQSNVCRILPSLDLVVARTATGPLHWDDGGFQRRLAEALA